MRLLASTFAFYFANAQISTDLSVSWLDSNGYQLIVKKIDGFVTQEQVTAGDDVERILFGCGPPEDIDTKIKLAARLEPNTYLQTRGTRTNAEFQSSTGVWVYNVPGKSFGFSPEQTIYLNAADVEESNQYMRLSHHNPFSDLYRCGNAPASAAGYYTVIYYKYKNWRVERSPGECSAPCGGGIRTVTKTCFSSKGEIDCPMSIVTETEKCNEDECAAGKPVLEFQETEKTFQDAVNFCSSIPSNSAEGRWELFYPINENEFNQAVEQHPVNKDPTSLKAHWLGITIKEKEDWSTLNGKSVAQNLLKWQLNSPNSSKDAAGKLLDECVILQVDGTLDDVDCTVTAPFICRWIDHNDNLCPSSSCWRTESDGSCTLKDQECVGLSVSCSIDGMKLTFPRDLFGSDGKTVFKTESQDNGCSPTDDGSKVNWNTPLGKCGMSVAKTSENIVFSQVVSVKSIRKAQDVINHNQDSLKIFTGDGIVTSVEFQCQFPLTADVSSAEINILQPDSVSATAIGVGNWENAFTLAYYDSEYTNKIPSINAKIGDTLNVMAAFTISNDDLELNWYINSCTVVEGIHQVKIIKDSCFAEVVGTKFVGVSTDNPNDDKVVTEKFKFQYVTFGLGTDNNAVHKTQELQCAITFCTKDDKSAECNLTSKTCPASGNDAVFKYTKYGE